MVPLSRSGIVTGPLAPIRLGNQELFIMLDALGAYLKQSSLNGMPVDYLICVDTLARRLELMLGTSATYQLAPAEGLPEAATPELVPGVTTR